MRPQNQQFSIQWSQKHCSPGRPISAVSFEEISKVFTARYGLKDSYTELVHIILLLEGAP